MTKPLRVGLMVPESNTTMEGELAAWMPPGTQITRVGIPRTSGGLLTKATMPAYRDAALALAAQHFSPATHDIVAYGCTAAGFISGPAGDAELAEDLARATGLPVVTTAGAMVKALQDAGARRIAVVTPYLDGVNEQLTEFLTDGGIAVDRLASFRAPDLAALCAITSDQVLELAERTMGTDVDALFIGCSQLPTHAVLEGLSQRFGKPALSSISATAWLARQVMEQRAAA
jgi:maleate cis-trans isomerase